VRGAFLALVLRGSGLLRLADSPTAGPEVEEEQEVSAVPC
jgi:hypothetical protein